MIFDEYREKIREAITLDPYTRGRLTLVNPQHREEVRLDLQTDRMLDIISQAITDYEKSRSSTPIIISDLNGESSASVSRMVKRQTLYNAARSGLFDDEATTILLQLAKEPE